MSITINWLPLRTATPDSIKVWRSDQRKGTYILLATLDGTLLTYEDTTAVNNKVYFYQIENIVGNDTGQSLIVPAANFPNSGPGPASIIRGDWEFGYFGPVLPADLPTFTMIKNATGVSSDGTTNNASTWFKWIVNGRIIFFPFTFYNYDVSGAYNTLGKMFIYPAGSDRIANGVTIPLNGFNFLIRCPYATNKFTTELNPNGEFVTGSGTYLDVNDDTITKSEIQAIQNTFSGQSVTTPKLSKGYKVNDTAFNFRNNVTYWLTNTYVDQYKTAMPGGSNSQSIQEVYAQRILSGDPCSFLPVYELLL